MVYQLAGFDLDGTLLQSDKTISPETIEAIRRLASVGVSFSVATGRPLSGVLETAQKLGIPCLYAVCSNGAAVYRITEKQITALHRLALPAVTAQRLYELAEESQINLLLQCKGAVYTNRMNWYAEQEAGYNRQTVKKLTKGFFQMPEADAIEKAVIADEEERVSAFLSQAVLPGRWDVNQIRSMPCYLEFMNPAADKAVGLAWVAHFLGLQMTEVIAFGDGSNDIAMLREAGLGVAMGNADAQVIEAADRRTSGNDENGVATALWEIFYDRLT